MTDSIEEKLNKQINDLKDLGPVRKRPPHEVRSLFFSVTPQEFETAKNGFFALMGRYGVTGDDALLISEALSYMFYHMLTDLHGTIDLRDEELASKVKWQ